MDTMIQEFRQESWMRQRTLDSLLEQIVRRFGSKETPQRARGYLQGLLKTVERKNGWQLVDLTWQQVPSRIEHLPDRARCDSDAVLVVHEPDFLRRDVMRLASGANTAALQAASRSGRATLF